MTPLQLPLALPLWYLAGLRSTRREIRDLLGEPHFIETDPRCTCGGPEDVWGFVLPSGQRLLFTHEESQFSYAHIYADPADLAPILDALGIGHDDPRVERHPEPWRVT